jgi:putative membrane protein
MCWGQRPVSIVRQTPTNYEEQTMRKIFFSAGALAFGLTMAGVVGSGLPAAHAQSGVGSGNTGGSVAFVREAGNAGEFEVQSGRMALERSQHPGVRGYAAQTVKDASEMLNRVKFINNANVAASMPGGVNANQQGELNRLASLSGPDFDREYMRSQVTVSQYMANFFRGYGATGESETLRTYAAKAATDYDAQVEKARTIAGSLQ